MLGRFTKIVLIILNIIISQQLNSENKLISLSQIQNQTKIHDNITKRNNTILLHDEINNDLYYLGPGDELLINIP